MLFIRPLQRDILPTIARILFCLSTMLPTLGWSLGLAEACNPMRVNTCALPFPSDLFTVVDASSPTGKRVQIPDEVFSLFAQETPEHPVGLDVSLRPNALYAHSSGYSAAVPVLFELTAPVDPDLLPQDGGKVLLVFEIGGNGEVVPINAGVMKPSQFTGVARADTVIEAFPRSRWQFGRSYVAILTRAITPLAGGEFERAPGVQAIFDDTTSELAQVHAPALATALPALEGMGLTADDILALTFFTVRDQAEVITPLATMIDKVYNEEHEIRGWQVEHHANSVKAATITGQVRLSNYRNAKGDFIFDRNYPGDDYWADFILVIPAAARTKPVPLVIYGHGIGSKKESMKVVDKFNAQRGIATFAIDQPNHGTRSAIDGGFIWDIMAAEKLSCVTGMVSQSSLDMVSVLAAVTRQLSHVNSLPRNPNADLFPWLALNNYDTLPDIDLSHIYYEGTSMGGVLGSAFLGLTPRLDGAYLQVSGTGIINVLTHSTLWNRFRKMVPSGMVGAELAAYLGMMTQALDYGDGINSIHHAREGTQALPYPYAPFPLALQMGMDDGIVFNNASVALAELVQLPMMLPDKPNNAALMARYEQLPLTHLGDNEWLDADGYGFRMVQPFHVPISESSWLGRLFDDALDMANAVAPHASFFSPGSRQFQSVWTQRVILGNSYPVSEDEDSQSNADTAGEQ